MRRRGPGGDAGPCLSGLARLGWAMGQQDGLFADELPPGPTPAPRIFGAGTLYLQVPVGVAELILAAAGKQDH